MLEYTFELTPRAPIHVGTGEVVTPGEYFIFQEDASKERNVGYLYVCDLGTIPDKELGDFRDKIVQWIGENPFTWLLNVSKSRELEKVIKSRAKYRCALQGATYEKIKERWGKGSSELAIATVQRTLTGPYIPGSSIKGAIRTALVYSKLSPPISFEEIRGRENEEKFLKKSLEWERKVLDPSSDGKISDDLLSALKVSDTNSVSCITAVVLPKHVGMGKSPQEMQDYRECLLPPNPKKPYQLTFELRIDDDLLRQRSKQGKLSLEDIRQACRRFYTDVLTAEIAYWEDGNTEEDRKALEFCKEMQQEIESDKEIIPIRLGWGCGMNSVSVNIAKTESRQERQHKDIWRYRYYPQTRVLLAGKPPGWALLKQKEE
jgi:CRISPR-associated protein Csm5